MARGGINSQESDGQGCCANGASCFSGEQKSESQHSSTSRNSDNLGRQHSVQAELFHQRLYQSEG